MTDKENNFNKYQNETDSTIHQEQEYVYAQPGNVIKSVGDKQGRKFRPRTVLIPLGFMILHVLIINIVAIIYLLGFVFIKSIIQANGFNSELLMDAEYLNQMLMQNTSQIAVFYALALLPVYLIYLHFAGKKRTDVVWLNKTKTSNWFASIALIIGAMGLTNLYFIVLDWASSKSNFISGLMNDYIELSSSAFSTETNYIWLILGIGIAAPVVEELLFRGIIQGELRRAMPEWLAVVIQALAFAIFHMQPVQSVYVFIPGLLLGAAYSWTKSLWVPIVMHIFFNLLGSLVPSLLQSDEMLQQIVVITEMAFIPVAIAAGVFMYLNRFKTTQPNKSEGEVLYESSI